MGNLCQSQEKRDKQSINQMARSNQQHDCKKYGNTYATPTRHGVRYSVPDKSGIRSETSYNHEEYVENVSNLRARTQSSIESN